MPGAFVLIDAGGQQGTYIRIQKKLTRLSSDNLTVPPFPIRLDLNSQVNLPVQQSSNFNNRYEKLGIFIVLSSTLLFLPLVVR